MINTLNSPAAGVAYMLWLRVRWLLGAMLLLVAVLAIVVQTSDSAIGMVFFGVFGIMALGVPLVGHLTLGPTDFGKRESSYPTDMLVLPLRTSALVGWPMFYGVSLCCLLWAMITLLVIWPVGLPLPVVWPAALLGAGLAWLQAICWCPFRSRLSRFPMVVLPAVPLSFAVEWACANYASNFVAVTVAIGSFAWAVVAYLFAVRGLSQARTGGLPREWNLDRFRSWVGAVLRMGGSAEPSFRTAAAAQLWHECRRTVITLPIVFGFVSLPMLLMAVVGMLSGTAAGTLMFGSTRISPAEVSLLMMCAIFVFLSGTFGSNLGKFDMSGREEMPAFLATRPMSTARFVAIKFVAATLSVGISWLIMLVVIGLWAIVETSPWNLRGSMVRAAYSTAGWREVAAVVLVGGLLLALALRAAVNGMWLSLAGRKWFAVTINIVTFCGLMLAVFLGRWLYGEKQFVAWAVGNLPWAVGALMTLKIVTAAWVLRELRRYQLVDRVLLWRCLVGWVVGYVSLIGLASIYFEISSMLLAGLFLVMPLTRVAVAPLALHWNRHR